MHGSIVAPVLPHIMYSLSFGTSIPTSFNILFYSCFTGFSLNIMLLC